VGLCPAALEKGRGLRTALTLYMPDRARQCFSVAKFAQLSSCVSEVDFGDFGQLFGVHDASPIVLGDRDLARGSEAMVRRCAANTLRQVKVMR